MPTKLRDWVKRNYKELLKAIGTFVAIAHGLHNGWLIDLLVGVWEWLGERRELYNVQVLVGLVAILYLLWRLGWLLRRWDREDVTIVLPDGLMRFTAEPRIRELLRKETRDLPDETLNRLLKGPVHHDLNCMGEAVVRSHDGDFLVASSCPRCNENLDSYFASGPVEDMKRWVFSELRVLHEQGQEIRGVVTIG